MKCPVYLTEADGTVRCIGEVIEKDGKKIFFTRRQSSKHFYRRLNGWGIDKEILEKNLLAQVHLIVILDDDTKTLYITSPQTFVGKGETIHYYPYRPQVILPMDFWRLKRARARH